VVGYGLTVGDEALESVAVRPMALLDMTYALAAALAMLAAAAALQSLALAPLGYAAGRNALGFVGLVLIGRRVIGGQGATLLPAVLAVFAAIFGGDASGEARWWAWVATPHDDQRSWAFALGLLVLGALSASGLRLRRR
jgi:hypothetical protein